jgi:hypothetical protein
MAIMARYTWKDGHFRDASGEPMPIPDRKGEVCVPAIISDIPDYRSPIDGKMITSRSQRREDLRRNNCVEYEPSLVKIHREKGKPVFKNKRFAKKYNLPLHEAYR